MKKFQKYVSQGKKVAKVNPLVGYYCHLYVVKEGMKIQDKSSNDMKMMGDLMEWLEKNKPAEVDSLPEGAAQEQCELFARKVFEHADASDRSGKPITKSTALSFMAAYVYIDICEQFGTLSEELKGQTVYAKWKCVDILKALREGREPMMGNYEEQQEALNPTQPEPEPFFTPGNDVAPEPQDDNGPSALDLYFDGPGGVQPEPDRRPPAEMPSFQVSDFEVPPVFVPPASEPPQPAAPSNDDMMFNMNDNPNLFTQPKYAPPSAYAPAAADDVSFIGSYSNGVQDGPLDGPLPEVRQVAKPAVRSEGGEFFVLGYDRKSETRTDAVILATKLAKHAVSALRFDDTKTACEKLEQALAELSKYRNVKGANADDGDDDYDPFKFLDE